jgi:[ribosomal protein S18]-alanine N-acetyltransferase
MELAQGEMRAKSVKECYLEVRVSNEGAIKLYQRLSYKITGKLEAYYRDGEPAYLMAVQIGS